jgi:flagellum-specific peptidoglycan hydrolase FlgJ
MIFVLFFSLKISAQNSYINQYKSLATELSQEFGIPTTVILSIAYMETGGGTSSACKVLNNHFGMTGKNDINSSRFKVLMIPKLLIAPFVNGFQKEIL